MFSASCRCDTERQLISLPLLSLPSQHSTHAGSNKLLKQQLRLNVSSQQLPASGPPRTQHAKVCEQTSLSRVELGATTGETRASCWNHGEQLALVTAGYSVQFKASNVSKVARSPLVAEQDGSSGRSVAGFDSRVAPRRLAVGRRSGWNDSHIVVKVCIVSWLNWLSPNLFSTWRCAMAIFGILLLKKAHR